jgi:hypothetical protein
MTAEEVLQKFALGGRSLAELHEIRGLLAAYLESTPLPLPAVPLEHQDLINAGLFR